MFRRGARPGDVVRLQLVGARIPRGTLEVVSELGDPALDSLLAAIPEIREAAEAWVKRYHQ